MKPILHNVALCSATLGALVAAAPALANGVHAQCPAGILTQSLDPVTGKNLTLDVRHPQASTDPGCRDIAAPTFFDTCKVLKDPATGQPSGQTTNPSVVCRSIVCGDGHVNMADGSDTFIFGFTDVTNAPEDLILTRGMPLAPNAIPLGGANFSAPTMIMREGQDFYLTLTNAGFRERPDLTDSHTVHYHGFPNAASVFDGEPMASFGINMGASVTYYYKNQYAGTYMYHCHVEAAEHMQMGMLGNLYVLPAQDGTPIPYRGKTYSKFAFSDCPRAGDPLCGSTGYDAMVFLQESAFDPMFHHADNTYNRISFANMNDVYGMLNGRGYPDTANPSELINVNNHPSQPIPAIPMTIDAGGNRAPLVIHQGNRVLLRLTSLSTVDFYTVTVLGIPMRIVGQGAQLLKGPTGANTSYPTASVTLGGGEGVDAILDTTSVAPGTYFIYTTNLNRLSNNTEDFGGMMTEIVVSP